MRCPRCNGLMYAMEMRDSHAMVRSAGLACILCGDIIDPIIARNRLKTLLGLAVEFWLGKLL